MMVGLKLVRVGMNMEEATIVKWHKGPGESFKAGEVLYEIETEKTTLEVTASGDGVLIEQCVSEGENAQVGATVCRIETQTVTES